MKGGESRMEVETERGGEGVRKRGIGKESRGGKKEEERRRKRRKR